MMHQIEIAVTLRIMKVRSSDKSCECLQSQNFTLRNSSGANKTVSRDKTVSMSTIKVVIFRNNKEKTENM